MAMATTTTAAMPVSDEDDYDAAAAVINARKERIRYVVRARADSFRRARRIHVFISASCSFIR